MTKKERLLASAKKLIAAQGFDKTSIREIANDAGVNSALIAYYFGGKEGLIPAIFDFYFPEINHDRGCETPLEALEDSVRRFIMLRAEDQELVDILHSEIILKSPRLELIQPSIRSVWQHLYALLQVNQKEGHIDIASTDAAYLFLLAGISFPYHNKIFLTNSSTITLDESTIDHIVAMLMKGLM